MKTTLLHPISILTLILTFTFITGCSSPSLSPVPEPKNSEQTESVATEPPTENAPSDVIARRAQPDIKCPKKARLMNGKCVLPVEETE